MATQSGTRREQLQPGPVCGVCPLYLTCNAICEPVEQLLPSMERGRVDPEDLPRLHMGIRLTNAILDHEEVLSARQREVVRLYFRESLQQQDIAESLGITQQAVNELLRRARESVGLFLRELTAQNGALDTTAGNSELAAAQNGATGVLSSGPQSSGSHNTARNTSARNPAQRRP